MMDDVLQKLPGEACGVLGGKDQVVVFVRPVKNVSQRADRFRMDPEEQIQALFELEDRNLELVGIYHSHPFGPTSPSLVDIEEAAFPEAAYLIWYPSGNTWRCKAFAMREERPEEIPLRIIP